MSLVPELNLGEGHGRMEGAKVPKVYTFTTKLAKHSVKPRETTVIGGGGKCPLPIGSATVRRRQHTYVLRRLNAYFRWIISSVLDI